MSPWTAPETRQLTSRDLMILIAVSVLPIMAVTSLLKNVHTALGKVSGLAIALISPVFLFLSWYISGLNTGEDEDLASPLLLLYIVLGFLAFTGPVVLYFIDHYAGNMVTAAQLALLGYLAFREWTG